MSTIVPMPVRVKPPPADSGTAREGATSRGLSAELGSEKRECAFDGPCYGAVEGRVPRRGLAGASIGQDSRQRDVLGATQQSQDVERILGDVGVSSRVVQTVADLVHFGDEQCSGACDPNREAPWVSIERPDLHLTVVDQCELKTWSLAGEAVTLRAEAGGTRSGAADSLGYQEIEIDQDARSSHLFFGHPGTDDRPAGTDLRHEA